MMKYVAGGLAVGLGQGLTEVGRQNGIAKRDAMLAQMKDQRSRRDRDWRQQDRREDRDWRQQDRREDREWTVADRNDERSYQGERDDKLHGQAVDLEGLSQRHRLALEDKRARHRFEQDEISHGRDVALRNLDADLTETEAKKAQRRGQEDAVFQRGLDVHMPAPATARAGAAAAGDADGTAMTREVEYLAESLASVRGTGAVTAQDRLDAAALRRDPTGADVEKGDRLKLRNMLLQESIRSASRMFRTPDMAELLAKANELAGLNPDEPGPEGAAPPAQPAPAGLGAGMEAGPASAPGVPAVGEVVDGYRYLGGDPSDPSSWVEVGG